MMSWLVYNALAALPFVALALLLEIAGRRRPALVHIAWLAVLVRMVAPPLPVWTSGPPAPLVLRSSSASWFGDWIAAITGVLGNNWSAWVYWILVVVWVVGVALLAAREGQRFAFVSSRLRRAEGAPPNVRRGAEGVASELGVRPPPVRMLAEAPSPFVWGLRRSVLVLPRGAGLHRTVYAHEMAHLRRRDHWVGWLELLALGLCWWNPIYWLARRRLHRAAELACDEWVVRHFPGERHEYARALVDTAAAASAGTSAVALPVAGHGDARELGVRLERVLEGRPRRGSRAALATALASLCALVVLSLPGLALPTVASFRASLPWNNVRGSSECRAVLVETQAQLRADPTDAVALRRRAVALMMLGRFEEAMVCFERQIELGVEAAGARYNLACALARLGRADEAIDQLEQSAASGFEVGPYLPVDPDLESLRELERFQELVESLAVSR